MSEWPKVEVFYADPVDEDGNKVGTAGPMKITTPWGTFEATKVPAEEIVLDPETTIHVDLSDE